jgi:Family of unknown function (DUF5684)
MSLLSLFAQSDFTTDATFESAFETSELTTSTDAAAGLAIFSGTLMLVWLVAAVFFIACQWKIFTKAGKPGWAAIVPIYNAIVLLEIVGRPVWWIVLMLIPFVNVVIAIIVAIDLAKAFGKDAGYGLLLAFVPIIGYPMLAFGKATHVGAGAAAGTTAPAYPSTPATPDAGQQAAAAPAAEAAPSPAPEAPSDPTQQTPAS